MSKICNFWETWDIDCISYCSSSVFGVFFLSTFVPTQAQYILIHQALLEHNQFGETEIALSELHSMLSTLKQQNSGNEPTLMEEEFEVWIFVIHLSVAFV